MLKKQTSLKSVKEATLFKYSPGQNSLNSIKLLNSSRGTDLHCSGLSSVLALEPIHQHVDRTALRSSAHQNVHLILQSHTADPVRGHQMMMHQLDAHRNFGCLIYSKLQELTSS